VLSRLKSGWTACRREQLGVDPVVRRRDVSETPSPLAQNARGAAVPALVWSEEHRPAPDNIVMVQITLSARRKPGQKRKLYQRMAEIIAKNPGLRPQDL